MTLIFATATLTVITYLEKKMHRNLSDDVHHSSAEGDAASSDG